MTMKTFALNIALLTASCSLLVAQTEWNKEVPFQPATGVTPTMAILNLAGIGAVVNKVEGGGVITRIVPGSGAEDARLQVSDIITHVDEKDISALDLSQIASLLRGDPDTTVLLKIERKGLKNPVEVRVTRHPVKLDDGKTNPESSGTAVPKTD